MVTARSEGLEMSVKRTFCTVLSKENLTEIRDEMLHVFPTWAKVIAIGSAAIAADQYLIERQLKPMQRKLDKLDTDVKSRLDKLDTDV